MTIYEKIKELIKESLKNRQDELKSNLKVILGEFERMSDGKPIDDDLAIKVLKKLKASELEVMKILKSEESVFLKLVESFLPDMADEDEIKEYIKTLDFTKYKNKMQSMRDIMSHFGARADGNLVKKILTDF
jgi:uncharacterized protein YqeY